MINARFFVVPMILATIAGIAEFANTWLVISHSYPPDSALLYILIPPIQLILTVFFPFGVMYSLPTNVDSKDQFKSLFISIFLGCLIGTLIAFGVRTYAVYSSGGTFGSSFVSNISGFAWGITGSAFSGVLFVSLAAVLLAYYRKHEVVPGNPT